MAKKSKAKDAKKQARKTEKGKTPAAETPGASGSSSKLQSAFAKITPPKGFAIKRP